MDSLTHIVIGACMGEAFAGKKLGKRALFLGALAQSLPDIDFLASLWTENAQNLLAHRGFSHSFLFVLLVSPFLGLLAERLHRPHNITWMRWSIFFGAQALIHLLIDGMNVYGTGWFEPFSHVRISYNWIYVADPLYSIWPFFAFMALLILSRKSTHRMNWVKMGMGISTLYLFLGAYNKWQIDKNVRWNLKEQKIRYSDYISTPTPLNTLLWYVVVRSDSGFYIGYRSVFDKNKTIPFHYVHQNKEWLEPVEDKEDLQRLIRFSKGFYTVEKRNDSLVFNDLRFGQILGWRDKNASFVFYYFLQNPDGNELVVQRGRFAKWNFSETRFFLRRMFGGSS